MTPTQEAATLRAIAVASRAIDTWITDLRRRQDISDEMADALDKHIVTFGKAADSFLCFAQDREWDAPATPFCLAMRKKGVVIVRGDAG